jgi:hypothetical protein
LTQSWIDSNKTKPKLSDEVLQRLLSEAQTALPSRLSTLREEDEDG